MTTVDLCVLAPIGLVLWTASLCVAAEAIRLAFRRLAPNHRLERLTRELEETRKRLADTEAKLRASERPAPPLRPAVAIFPAEGIAREVNGR